MKKVVAILLTICLAAAVFAACTKKTENNETDSTTENPYSTSTITTDDAVIKEADAIKLIESYSAEELSLSDEDMKNCSFMVSGSGIQIEDDYYVQVVAAIKNEHYNENGEVSYTLDNKGEYYIRYDGKQILKKDMTSEEDKYDEMEVKELPADEAVSE